MFFKLPGDEVVLIDGGPADAGERVVSYLKSAGVNKIDLLIATHPHEDHIGGLLSVLDSFPVAKVWDSGHNLGTATQRKFLESVKKSKSKFEIAREGYSQKIGDVTIKVIAAGTRPQNKDDANAAGIITHVSWKKISFLLMADAEHKDSKTIDKYPRASALKISHHGSRNGTSRTLLQKVKPRVAVVSFGENNPYGHPHKEVLRLLDEFNIKLYSTTGGNIVLISDGEKFSVDYVEFSEKGLIDTIKSVLDVFFKW